MNFSETDVVRYGSRPHEPRRRFDIIVVAADTSGRRVAGAIRQLRRGTRGPTTITENVVIGNTAHLQPLLQDA